MPPVHHGRFTVNPEKSRLRKDNSARYDLVVFDEWDDDLQHVRSHSVSMPEPLASRELSVIIDGLNTGKIQPRFLLGKSPD
jgi:hypothetical protein